MMKVKSSVLGLVACGLFFGVPAAMAQKAGQPAAPSTKHDDHAGHKHDKAEIGHPAPEFTLTDTDGKTVKLSDYKGKVVVIDWFNPDCPVCAMHYKANTVQQTAAKFKDKGVVFLAINSGGKGMQGHGKDRNAKAKTDWKLDFPVLLDESGKVGKAYGAKTTPHCYVIDSKGVLVYAGAIDDGAENFGGKIGKVNYVEKALNEVLKGETVSTPTTKPYGCGVKYAKGA